MSPDFGSSEAASEAGKLGGKARAEALTPERRSAIARRAVEARWAKEGKTPVLRATHTGTLKFGTIEVECAVLEDGTRVLSQRGFAKAVGASKPSAMNRRGDGAGELPSFMTADNLKLFIDEELTAAAKPIVFAPIHGGRTAYGIRAQVVPKVCNVWLKARDAGVLRKNQRHLAEGADIIIRALAEVAIVALIDEATGYQDVRARDALAKILEAFVAKELRKWVKTFPPDYFKEMCRLKGKSFTADMKLPRYFGVHTNDVVYSRLAPGVLAELRTKNPATENGRRKHKNFQWLTEDIGNPKLLQHLAAVVALMRASPNWDEFKTLIDRALPKYQSLPLLDGNEFDTE